MRLRVVLGVRGGIAADKAVDVCRSCPVRLACLDDALAYEDGAERATFGVRGGLTAMERVEMIRHGPLVDHFPQVAVTAVLIEVELDETQMTDSGHWCDVVGVAELVGAAAAVLATGSVPRAAIAYNRARAPGDAMPRRRRR